MTIPPVSPDVPPAIPPAPPTGGEWAGRLLVVVVLVCCVLGVLVIGKGPLVAAQSSNAGAAGIGLASLIANATGDGIALVKFSGVLQFGSEASMYGLSRLSPTESLIHQLKQVRQDKHVKGVVLRINSPGGTLAASQEIANQVREIARTMPIVVSMADVAASGGYYISAPATYILCDAGTMTGSIGVIMSLMNYEQLAKHYGVTFPTFVSGAFKDMGSPTRPMRPEEVVLFQKYVKDARDQFVKSVSLGRVTKARIEAKDGKDADFVKKAGRKPEIGFLSYSDIDKIADGRVFLGEDAVKVGLVDALGDEADAIEKCGLLADQGKTPRIIKPNPWEEILQGIGGASAAEGHAFQLPPRGTAPFLYLCPVGL